MMRDFVDRMGPQRSFLRVVLSGLALLGVLWVSPSAWADDGAMASEAANAGAALGEAEPATGPGIERLGFMVGNWAVTARDQDGKLQFDTVSTIRPILNGKALEEEVIGYWGGLEWPMRLLRSYDKFQDKYRMVALDGRHGFLDIYEGTWGEGGLEESNVAGGTYSEFEGTRYFYRSRLERLDSGFRMTTEASGDGGKTWQAAGSFRYTPAP